jgi:hypothetical protein
MSFVNGDLWERAFETADGVVEMLAEVVVEGRRLELRDVAVYPRGVRRMKVSVGELMMAAGYCRRGC